MKKAKQYKPRQSGAKKYVSPTSRRNMNARGYDKDWSNYRFRFLHYNPACYACGGKANVVDHIMTARSRPDLFENTRNHMPLCAGCHNYITGKFDRLEVQDLDGKMKWLQKRRNELGVKVKVKPLPSYRKKR